MELIFQGILIGLTLAIMMGPIFVTLLQASLDSGKKGGVFVGLGVWISDFSIILLSYVFLKRIKSMFENPKVVYTLGIIGGFILIVYGVITLVKKVSELGVRKSKMSKAKNYALYIVQGFVVNTLNPFTFAFWISIISSYVIVKGLSITEAITFFGSILLTIVVTDILKVFLAERIKQFLDVKHLTLVNRILGIALIVFGIVLFARTFLT